MVGWRKGVQRRERRRKGSEQAEEIRDLIKLPVWVRALRCKAALHDNSSLSEFHSMKEASFTLNYCG